ncbi:sugar phosphate isomerase/epimerase family protein [Azohydromonas australica]|uniref:sugar phosphate isomerase/epimerase family protein n=1 Tax=Azohydromonas australica TaxID=364039 RepID=UPI0004196377|nr:TIM barrel protein [Azohydromonas australica]
MLKHLTLAHLTLGTTPLQTIEAAAAAGFGAVGLRICARRPGEPFDTPVLGVPTMVRQLRQRASDLGVRLSNVSAYQFYPEVGWDDVAPVIDTVAELQVPIIVANCFDPDTARFTDVFGRYCERAAQAGIRMALEFLPYSGVRDLATACRIVASVGTASAGLLIDALHLDRCGGGPQDLRGLPAERVVFAQLCDARRPDGPMTDAELLAEARTARLPAGTGALPLFDFLDALPPGCEIEYEVARADMAQRSPLEKALAAAADASRFMERYSRRHHAAVTEGTNA